jgi:hypothetical protein
LNIKCRFWFSLQLLSVTFFILRRIQWDITINLSRYSCDALVISHILMKHEFPRQIFEKSNIKFRENQPSGRRFLPCGQRRTERYDEANSRFSKSCEIAQNDFCLVQVSFYQSKKNSSSWRTEFNPRSAHVRFVGNKVTLRQVFLQALRFPPSVLFHHHTIFIY